MNQLFETDDRPRPNPYYAWYVVAVLTSLYILSFIDRTIIVLLIEPIKRDLGLSDTQISLLYGFAFAVFYTFLGVPIARLADRRSRRVIVAIGVAFWSLMTALCGASKNFVQLFAARVGVGVGEAALSPAAYSMISDYFPPDRRARALSVYTMGVYLGAGTAMLLGSFIIGWMREVPELNLPLVGPIRSWQLMFYAVGLPGLLFALLALTIREPERRESSTGAQNVGLREALAYFVGRWRFYIVFCAGMACIVMYTYSLTAWVPSFLIRSFGWDAARAGRYFGTVLLVFPTIGVLAGGWISSYREQRGDTTINVRMAMISLGGMLVPAAFMTLVDSPFLSLLILALIKIIAGLPLGLAVAALHSVTPNQLRAQSVALYLFTINIIGLGLGPLLVALLTDHVFRDESALRFSMAIVGVGACVIGLLLTRYSVTHYERLRNNVSTH